MKISDIFEVTYGSKLDWNKTKEVDNNGVAFVSRSSNNNGVVGYVELINGKTPFDSGLITVTLGGSYLLSAFLQIRPFYTAQNVAVLRPKIKLTDEQKLFFCMCITSNRFKYSAFGREANRTIKNIVIPALSDMPEWVNGTITSKFDGVNKKKKGELRDMPHFEDTVTIDDLFNVYNGITSNGLDEKETPFDGCIFFLRPAATQKRTLRSYIEKSTIPKNKIFPKETLFVSTNGEGSHSYAYVCPSEFVPNSDISVLIPKSEMSIQEKIFYSRCITSNRYLFSYGRKPKGMKLKSIKIPKAPPTEIINFIDSLPFSYDL